MEERRMVSVDDLLKNEKKLAVVGLGYVGLPLAVAFSEKVEVVGFDNNEAKLQLYKEGKDPTNELGDEVIKNCSVEFTCDAKRLQEAYFIIVAVPTPVNSDHTPNLLPVERASRTLGKNLKKGAIVVYESTVYPGVTEEICVPILEQESGLRCGEDFFVGYSPERINPGDKIHTLRSIVKIVSGMNNDTLDVISRVYELVVEAGVYRAESIKVAEAAKVIENSQRDINIAFMNELSIMFNKLGIDTQSVINAAKTKWNFLDFKPGLVGGHCIGVDPYYLTYRSEEMGYHSQLILAGRRINDEMGRYVANNIIKQLIKNDVNVKKAKVGVLGFSFKENCPDTRNTKVIDIINELKEYEINPLVYDPIADDVEAKNLYDIELCDSGQLLDLDAIVLAVSHDVFKSYNIEHFDSMSSEHKILIDVKGLKSKELFMDAGYSYWRL